MLGLAFCALAIASVADAEPDVKGITFSRTVTPGGKSSGYLGINPGCSSTDAYGSNDCTLAWGSSINVLANYSLSEDLTAGSTLDLDLKVDGLLPLKTSCPMCGGNCTINIPVVKQKVSFAMPPCPIKKGAGGNSTAVTLPADPLKSGKVSIKGTISVTDQSKANVASIMLDLTVE